jgi:hypothetical protein
MGKKQGSHYGAAFALHLACSWLHARRIHDDQTREKQQKHRHGMILALE